MKKSSMKNFIADRNKKTIILRGQAKAREFFSEIFVIFDHYTLESILCALGLEIFCVVFKYFDGTSLQAWALETGDAFFRGGFSGFNEIISQNLWNAPHGVVNGPFLTGNLLFTIWNLPVLLGHYIFRTGYGISFATRMWGKLFFVLLAVLCGYIVDKIIVKISGNIKNGMMAAVLFWSSLSVVISVGYSMQDEIVYIFFILMGIYNAILDKRNISLIWLAVSCYTCPIMLLFAVPVILFFSEKLMITICRILMLLSATILQMRYINTVLHGITSENELRNIFDKSTFTFGVGSISIFAVVVLFIYMSQWSIKCDEPEQKITYLLWHLAVLSAAMCILSNLNHYRYMICIPFIILNILLIDNTQKLTNAVFCLLLFEAFRIWMMMNVTSFLNLSYLNFTKSFGGLYSYSDKVGSILNLIFPVLSKTLTIAGGFVVALAIWLLYICHPKQKREIICPFNIRAVLVAWTSIPLVFMMLLCIFLIKINILNVPLNVDTNDVNNAAITHHIDGKNYLEEYYCGKSANNLLITVVPYTEGNAYPSGQKLNLDIVDVESGETLSTQSYDASAINNGVAITYRIEDIKINKNHWYVFKFYSPDLIDNEEHYMRLFRSAEGSADLERHYANDFSGTVNFDIVSKVVTF